MTPPTQITDAMREAELLLPENLRDKYLDVLDETVYTEENFHIVSDWLLLTATALQRARAFVRVIENKH